LRCAILQKKGRDRFWLSRPNFNPAATN
jgi:hypothetical protein